MTHKYIVLVRQSGLEHSINHYPDHCPYCNAKVVINHADKHSFLKSNDLHLAATCPGCSKIFVSEYKLVEKNEPNRVVPTGQFTVVKYDLVGCAQPEILTKKEYDAILNANFPRTIEILKQAEKAEKINLPDAAGMAYRKALEF